jgi:hypothetical protein
LLIHSRFQQFFQNRFLYAHRPLQQSDLSMKSLVADIVKL